MADRLSILNPYPRKINGPDLLHHLVSNEANSNCIAIEYLSSDDVVEHLTYTSLHNCANALARTLRLAWETVAASNDALFVAPILIPQGPHLYISQLAALKAGAAFCPISPDVPEDRLRFILRDVEAKILLTTSDLKDGLPEVENVTIIAVDQVSSRMEREELSLNILPSQAAYIMYTSGSTGQPKGVIISHSAATQSLLAHDRHIPSFSRFLQFASPTFDVSVFEIFFPLFRGRTIVSGERRRLLNDLPTFINRMNIDSVELTPSVASNLLLGKSGLPTVKHLLTIGEMLKRDVIEEFGGSNDDGGVLHGMYGPTEATIHCTLQTSFSKEMPVGNIGVPLDTVSAFIIKPALSDDSSKERIDILPIGEEGELAVGGHQLADGYLNRPDQTSAAFVYHSEYGKLYRTGDRARVTPSGTLECSGRISSGQVKLRGQRIELGEIEYAASKLDGVRGVVADVIEGTLVVFCVSSPSISESNVRDTCRKWLPASMVPTDVVLPQSLPYLPSGKIDRNALRALYSEMKLHHPTANGTTNPVLQAIVDVISDVLGVRVDEHTNLAATGLDSLSSIRIAAQLRIAGFHQLDATTLLESRTVQEIENQLNNLEVEQSVAVSELDYADRWERFRDRVIDNPLLIERLDELDEIYPPTSMQAAMLSQTAKDSTAYCNSVELSISGHHIDRVQASLQELAPMHALLRSGFVFIDEKESSYAGIVWKGLHADQIRRVDQFERHFTIETDEELLTPCSFQILQSHDNIQILLQIHHSLYDQWSIEVLRADLGALLRGPSIPSRPQFQSVAQFQQAHEASALSDPAMDFWQEYLRDFSPSYIPAMNGRKLPRKLETSPWHAVLSDISSAREKTRKIGYNLPSVFQAVMNYILGCYTGSTDVTFGVVFSGRHFPIANLERVFGPCLTTLPLRADCSTMRTKADFVRLVQNRSRNLQKHALTPLSDIKRLAVSAPGTPLFDALFVWQETTLDLEESEQIVKEVQSKDQHEFNLVLEFEPWNNGVRARATYQQSLVQPHQVEILFRQMAAIANNIIEDPNTPVEEMSSCLSSDLLSISNPSPTISSTKRSLVSSIERHARELPESTALVFANGIDIDTDNAESLTYSDLNKQSNRMGNFLRSLCILPDDLVCICMEKSIDLYISILATIKVGAGYLPLVPETPTSRIKSILNQSRAKICLCDEGTVRKLEGLCAGGVFNVNRIELLNFESSNLDIEPDESHVAYSVFTSGSTGEPKGVSVTHGNLVSNLEVLSELYQVNPGNRLLQACSQAFDVSVFEIFFAFYTGICLCSAKKDLLFRNLEASIRTLNVTHLSLTPTVAALVDPRNVPKVRFLVTAGEGVTDLVHKRWAERGLHQGYGPSETTNICTLNLNMTSNDVLGNIGTPFRNTSAFVISRDNDFCLLPSGSVGEFAFGGEQVFRGYIGMEALNAAKIIDHPKFGRIYRSGDMGRILHDGSLLIAGRVDDQVKVRGNRVELGEINAVLLIDEMVHNCATILYGNEATTLRLATFVVPVKECRESIDGCKVAEMTKADISGLFERLEHALPPYMIPDLIVPVNKLPLTSQGKLDTKCLRSLLEKSDEDFLSSFAHTITEPENDEGWSSEEQHIAQAIKQFFQLPDARISRYMSFFAIGMNSLNAISFAKLVTNRMHTRIDVGMILQNPTIARLARIINRHPTKPTSSPFSSSLDLLPIEVIDEVRESCGFSDSQIECILPCTPLQEAMLSTSTSGAYNSALTLEITGDLERIKCCWEEMIKRHAILRTHFVSTKNPEHTHVQIVLKGMELPWRDQSFLTRNDTECSDGSITKQSSLDKFNPFLIDVFASRKRAQIVLHMHHAIYDGIAMSLLLKEVETAYAGTNLPPPASFIPFLTNMRLQNNAQATEFWSKQLKDFHPKPFPKPRKPRKAEEDVIPATLPISRHELDSYCKRHALPPLAVFQTVLFKVLAVCQNSRDVCFGSVVSGRTVSAEGVDTLVAPCFNTLPVRAKFDNISTNLELTKHLNSINVEMLKYQLTPLRRIQSLSASPSTHLFDCLLILQPQADILDSTIWKFEHESGSIDLPLTFEVLPDADSYVLNVHFLQPNLSREFAQDIIQTFVSALTSCLTYPHSNVAEFPKSDLARISGTLAYESRKDIKANGIDQNGDEQWTWAENIVRDVFVHFSHVDASRVGKNISMYQIGLDSLNAPQVARELRTKGLEIDAADVMETLTPYSLARLLQNRQPNDKMKDYCFDLEAFDKQHRSAVLDSLCPLGSQIESVRPCTAVQSGMIADSLNSYRRLYINHISYAVPEAISPNEIREAWRTVQDRHQVLRMGFHQLGHSQNPFSMVIWQPETITLPWYESAEDVSFDKMEQRAIEAIMDSIHTQAWAVTMSRRSNGNTMVLSLHHALYDAESLNIVLSDLENTLVSSRLRARPKIDSILGRTLAAETHPSEDSARFWRRALHNTSFVKFPDLTPSLVNDAALQSEQQMCSLSRSSIEHGCREKAVTIQALGQTAWGLLLAAYTGSPNVTFGTIFSGRSTFESQEVAFPSINTIPVPCSTSSSFQQLLHAMVDFNASAQRHRFTPLSEIQRFAGSAGRLLFDTVFVYQKTAESPLFDWPVIRETAAVDYSASLELESKSNEELSIRLTYNTSRIPQQHALLILQQYDYFLSQLASDSAASCLPSDKILSRLPAQSPILHSSRPFLHELFEDTALKHPNRPALEFIDGNTPGKISRKTWTYKELDGVANQVAHLIQRAGVQPNNIIAVCMKKCPEASFAFIGILKAGCSFLAIDPELPESRFKFILEDSGTRLLIGDEVEATDTIPEGVEYVQLTESALAGLPTSQTTNFLTSHDATCYCLYTSGTTGTPKGCEISHDNAVQAMMAFQRLFAGRWTDSSRWLQFASYWFDVSVLEQFWSWSVGITVLGAPRDLVLEDLPGFLRASKITHIDLTPSLARLLSPDDVPSLWDGVFITGGEPLKQEIIDAWGPKWTVCNGYGPTEATIGVTMNTFVGPEAKSLNIGRQFDNVGTYVLHPGSDEPVLRGTIGELCVSGRLVGKGYLNRPELTARQFPFLERLGERVYRTGDLVRMLADGSFLFIGRDDSQSKLRGQRLEVEEIDKVILQSAERITNVVTSVVKSKVGERETLVSFLVLDSAKATSSFHLESSKRSRRILNTAKRACMNGLPGYMVPTYILPITHLPLTVNNKIDTKRLTTLFHSTSMRELQLLQEDDEFRPLNTAEKSIFAVLNEMLPINSDEVSAQSNLFSLGLSSISAISFASLLKQAGFKNSNVGTVLRNPTLEQLASALSPDTIDREEDHSIDQAQLWMKAFNQSHRSEAAQILSVSPNDIETVLPCTPIQQGLIVESLKNRERPYFNSFRYVIEIQDIDALKQSFQKVVNAAAILRTRFIDTDEGFAQVVLHRTVVSFSEHHVPSKNIEASFAELKDRWLASNDQELRSPFEIHVVKANHRCFLIVHIHHSLYDGISYDMMLERMLDYYHSSQTKELDPSFTKALPYGPLRTMTGAKDFWTKRLEGFKYAAMPDAEKTRPSRTDALLHAFCIENQGSVESMRKKLGVSHQALVQSCFEIALRQFVPSARTYGMVVSGRSIELEGADRVLGPMFNTLPQILNIQPNKTLAEHVRSCHDLNVQAIPFQHTPLRDIRKWCGQHLADQMFEFLFVFQHKPDTGQPNLENPLQSIDTSTRAEYPLACEVNLNHDGSLFVNLVAQEQFFSLRDLQTFQERLENALHYLLSEDKASIGELFSIDTAKDLSTPRQLDSAPPEVNGIQRFEWSAPAMRIRELLAQLCAADVEDVDERSTIFTLGLDSIDAVKLASRLRQGGISIPVSGILQAQTIPRMLQVAQYGQLHTIPSTGPGKLERLGRQIRDADLVTPLSTADDVERVLPATPNQEALISGMLRSELKEYFNHDCMLLKPHTDLARLKSAWQTVIDATPILRTSFVEVSDPRIDAVFAQVVHQGGSLQFDEFECQSRKDLDNILNAVQEDVLLNIRHSPPLRLTVVTLPSETLLILSLAHAQYDGHSLALLHEDVQRAYNGTFEPRPTYDETIAKVLEISKESTRDHWNGILTGAQAQKFPRIRTKTEHSGLHRVEKCSSISASRAHEFTRSHGVTIQALAQTCWAVTLAYYVQNLDVLFGIVLACRDSDEAEMIAFPTMNTAVMRSSLHGSRLQMLLYMQRMFTDILPLQRTPLRFIQAAAASVVEKGDPELRDGLFDTLFIYQRRPVSSEAAEPLYESVGGSAQVEYPVAVEMEVVGDNLVIRAACKDNVLDEDGTTELVGRIDSVLQAIFHSPKEATVEFRGERVSLCGLDPFPLRTTSLKHSDVETKDEGLNVNIESSDSATTSTITQVLAQVSKTPLEEIKPTSTVESIGIDSISAIKVASLLRKQSITLRVSDIIRAKTPARMAEMATAPSIPPPDSEMVLQDTMLDIAQKYQFQDVASGAGIDANTIESMIPATAGQVYMVSMWQKSDGQLFFPTFEYRLETDLTIQQIEQVWLVLVDRHTILRTVFCATGHPDLSLLQIALRDAPDSFHYGDGVTSANQPWASLEAIRDGNTGYLLKLAIHHALYDAISLPLIMQDFQSLLSRASPPRPKLKFEDFVALSLTPTAKQAQKDFWIQYLRDTKPLQLSQPTNDGPQKKVEIFRPGLFSRTNDLESRVRKENISMQALLFAAYAKVYASLASKTHRNEPEPAKDVVLGIYLSNRSHLPDLDTLAAPTLNLVPLLVRNPQEKATLEVAKEVQRDLRQIARAENSAVGLWEVYEWTGVRIDTFVNLLKLPERFEGREEGSGVVLKALDERRVQERRRVEDAPDRGDFAVPKELEEFGVGGAYQHSVDVEMNVNDGQLDVGFFSPEAMAGLQDADEVLQELVSILEKFTGKAKE